MRIESVQNIFSQLNQFEWKMYGLALLPIELTGEKLELFITKISFLYPKAEFPIKQIRCISVTPVSDYRSSSAEPDGYVFGIAFDYGGTLDIEQFNPNMRLRFTVDQNGIQVKKYPDHEAVDYIPPLIRKWENLLTATNNYNNLIEEVLFDTVSVLSGI